MSDIAGDNNDNVVSNNNNNNNNSTTTSSATFKNGDTHNGPLPFPQSTTPSTTTTTTTTSTFHHPCPNSQLTLEEKHAKHTLKRQLKQSIRLRKYQTRLSQAISRGDTQVEHRARKELTDYIHNLQREAHSIWYQPEFQQQQQQQQLLQSLVLKDGMEGSTTTTTPTTIMEPVVISNARKWISKNIWYPLLPHLSLATQDNNQEFMVGHDMSNPPNIALEEEEGKEYSSSSIPLENQRQLAKESTSNKDPFYESQQSSSRQQRKQQQQQLFQSKQQHLQSIKQKQTQDARSLLHHMAKGTQTESMFENDDALLGYTRQKFVERALLAVSSLNRLQEIGAILIDTPNNTFHHDSHHATTTINNNNNNNNNNIINNNNNPMANQLWQRLLQVRQVVSIGCGPGCDAVGIITFLHQQHERQQQQQQRQAVNNISTTPETTTTQENKTNNNNNNNVVVLDRLVLMDYVMPQWKRLVVDALIPILSPHWVSRIETITCNVRYPLHHQHYDCTDSSTTTGRVNQAAWQCLSQPILNDHHDNNNDNTMLLPPPLDLIVVSYLLTEQRDQWLDFFKDLLQQCCDSRDKPSLILLSEPTAWQLHYFQTSLNQYLDGYQWLDSSRDSIPWQSMEGRMGPAVVLLQTKTKRNSTEG